MSNHESAITRREAIGAVATAVAMTATPAIVHATPALTVKLDIGGYKPTDTFFTDVYIDVDEQRTEFVPHRYLHGGFKGTSTRFTFHFPEATHYQQRFIQPLQGGSGGSEFAYGAPESDGSGIVSGLDTAVRLGAYLIQSNQGHIGTEKCPKAGDDPTIYGHRASAEVARFARYLATQIYGAPPSHGYVYGGSGGGHRTHLCIENVKDVWSGAVVYMTDTHVDPANVNTPAVTIQLILYSSLLNVQRLLGNKLQDVVDAMEPGGGGNPFATLNSDQSAALTDLYRCGFPRGAEFLLDPDLYVAQLSTWPPAAEQIKKLDPSYFTDFWTKPGYAGHDYPDQFTRDIVDGVYTIKKVVTAGEIADTAKALGPSADTALVLQARGLAKTLAMGISLEEVPKGYMPGAGFEIVSGAAAGRTLYCMGKASGAYVGVGLDVAGNIRFAGVKAGDKVKITNRPFLAYCHKHKHSVIPGEPGFANEVMDGIPLYPQRSVQLTAGPFSGGRNTAKLQGKVIWYHHSHDAAIWPATAFRFARAVRSTLGEKGAQETYRLRVTEHAQHTAATRASQGKPPYMVTRLINYLPQIEQGLQDLIDWVEKSTPPVGTNADYRDGKLVLPPTAKERGGIQAVVSATVNGKKRVDVKAGEAVTLAVEAEVPPGAGSIIAVEWDFDGLATFPFKHPGIDGKSTAVKLNTSFAFSKPGTYFPSVRVVSHRQGDVKATARRIDNLGRVRVVVT